MKPLHERLTQGKYNEYFDSKINYYSCKVQWQNLFQVEENFFFSKWRKTK